MTALVLARVLLASDEHGVDPGALLRTLAVAVLPYAVIGPVSGIIADHWDRRRVLGIVNVVRALITVFALIAVQAGSHRLGLVAAGALLSCARLVYTLRAASLPAVAGPAALVAVDSSSLLVGAVAGAGGAVLGSIGSAGAPSLLLVVSVGAQLVSALGFVTLPCDLGGRSAEQSVPLRLVVRRVGHLITAPATRMAIGVTSANRALLGAAFVTLVFFASNDLGYAEFGYIVALAVTGLGSLLGTMTAPRAANLLGLRGLIAVAFGVPALALTFAAAMGTPTMIGAAATLGFLVFQNLRISTDAVVQSSIADDARARVFSVYDATYNLSYLGGAALAILAGANDHTRAALVVVGLLSAVGASVALATWRCALPNSILGRTAP